MHRSLILLCASALGCAAIVSGCNVASEGTAPSQAPQELTIRECDDYVTAYHACLSRLDTSDESVAERRTAITRQVLVTAESDQAARDELRRTCVAGLERLRVACP